MPNLDELLEKSAALHRHLCPRQVLGVRMALLGGRELGLEVPQSGKRLVALVETDGCTADGIAVASGCWVGRRTLRVLDFGKVAVTFVDSETGRAVRVAPAPLSRKLAPRYAPEAGSRWEAYLLGYQRMPEEELLVSREVNLSVSLEKLVSKEGYRATCAGCGEEIFNEREVIRAGLVLCRACAGESYYNPVSVPSAEQGPGRNGRIKK